MKPRFTTLDDWLHWQESLHWQSIDLGLDRIREVAGRLSLFELPFQLITVAGTNGKGSTIALMEAMLASTEYSVGIYTSPHLYRYNERVCIDEIEVSDAMLCDAFSAIDEARQNISLSYFEFSTLAAVWLFQQKSVDIGILEVGLGGRLDAVNCWDADIAVITSIGIDHVDWLGDNRESIAREKAGIFRKDKIAVSGDPEPPKAIALLAEKVGAVLLQVGRDFDWQCAEANWQLKWNDLLWQELPFPALVGEHQVNNAATAIITLQHLQKVIIDKVMIEKALKRVSLSARMEFLQTKPDIILDVAHNPHAVEKLALWLEKNPIQGKTYALFTMLEDKDIATVVSHMAVYIDHWYVVGLAEPRGLSGENLVSRMTEKRVNKLDLSLYETVEMAWNTCKTKLGSHDRFVVFGSFGLISQFKVIF
ncbi:MAG: bifunctional tetrahydrofolate synthase/dihydrofolate synthase [Thiotrichaceae bacterium]|nr:bifunctional tetrahydrofolate synthase/dihydrofolate synthase [Thiotrichaceae bacterium]